MAKVKSTTVNLYSFKNKIHSGNSSLNNKIKIVLSYLIYNHLNLFQKINNNESSIDPYIPLSKNLLIKLCGMKSNYLKVVNYLNENKIVEWYQSEHSTSKRGFSYYNGGSKENYRGPNPKENYCKKCRFTEMFWNAVKSGNLTTSEIKIPISLEDSDFIVKEEFINQTFDNADYNEIKKYKDQLIKIKKQQESLKIAFEEAYIKKEIMIDTNDEYTKMIIEGLSPEQIIDSPSPVLDNTIKIESGYECDDIDEICNRPITVTKSKGYGKFINIGG